MIKYIKILLLLRIFIWPWKTLILIRGIPSTGKTTLAKQFPFSYTDTDMYIEGDEEYHIKFQRAYKKHQKDLIRLFKSKKTFLVPRVLPIWGSCKDYFKLAREWNYKIIVIDLFNFQTTEEAVKTNQNDCTKEIIENFQKDWKNWLSIQQFAENFSSVTYIPLLRDKNKYARHPHF